MLGDKTSFYNLLNYNQDTRNDFLPITWSNEALEYWSIGTLEYWENGI